MFALSTRIHLVAMLLATLAARGTADDMPTVKRVLPKKADRESLLIQTDHFVCHGWRIQRNAHSGDFRLLDDRDRVHCEGDFDACRERFESLRLEAELEPVAGKVVILLHGMFRNHRAGLAIEPALRDAGYTTIRMGYASTTTGIEEHAAALAKVVSFLPEATEINFVAHSMGNIVIRKYMSDTLIATGKLDPRIKRFVMLGPPNQGSALAVTAAESKFLNSLALKGFDQLGEEAEEFLGNLKPLPIEFGIIAGRSAEGSQGNPLLPGLDDLVVGVEETKLAGAADFAVLPIVHMRMFANRMVQPRVLSFLEHGYFVSEEQRQRLPLVAASAAAIDEATSGE